MEAEHIPSRPRKLFVIVGTSLLALFLIIGSGLLARKELAVTAQSSPSKSALVSQGKFDLGKSLLLESQRQAMWLVF
jgi:hypothetical protein